METAKPRLPAPATFVACVAQVASGADVLYDLMKLYQPGQRLPAKMPDPPPIDEWLRLYRDHDRVIDWAGHLFQIDEIFGMSASKLLDWFRLFLKMNQEQKVEVLKALPQDQLRLLAGMLSNATNPPDVSYFATMEARERAEDEADANRTDDLMVLPEAQFFYRVWLPCWVLYRVYPPTMFHRARSGRTDNDDSDALEDLLRLDKSVLGDPLIAERWHKACKNKSPALFKRLSRAAAGQPRGKMTRKKMRERLAALISQMAIAFDVEMNEGDIRELFENAAKARTGETDLHLPRGSEALSKAIQRHRTWPSLPTGRPDKNRA